MKKLNLLPLFIPLFTAFLSPSSHANPPMYPTNAAIWSNNMPTAPYQYQWPTQAKSAQAMPNAVIFPSSKNMQMQRYWQNNRQAMIYPNVFTQPRFPMLPQQYAYPPQAMYPKQAYIYPPQYPQQVMPYKTPALKNQPYIYPPQLPQQAAVPYKKPILNKPNTFNSIKKRQKKKPWGDVRYIWPDFYTDSTGDMWDNMVNAPYDAGRMPGGWRFPSLSSPDPVTVGDAITNQFPPIIDEMPNFMPLMN